MTQKAITLVSAEFTRPADTTAYAAGDAVSNSTSAPVLMEFTAAPHNGERGIIRSLRFTKSDNDTTNADFRVHLFSVAITAVNDNAAFSLAFADRGNRIGHIDIADTDLIGGAANEAYRSDFVLPFECASNDNKLYALIEARGAYTPGSEEQFFVELGLDLH